MHKTSSAVVCNAPRSHYNCPSLITFACHFCVCCDDFECVRVLTLAPLMFRQFRFIYVTRKYTARLCVCGVGSAADLLRAFWVEYFILTLSFPFARSLSCVLRLCLVFFLFFLSQSLTFRISAQLLLFNWNGVHSNCMASQSQSCLGVDLFLIDQIIFGAWHHDKM